MIIGIDPGKSGGIAVLDALGLFQGGIRMPVLQHGKRDLVNTRELGRFVRMATGDVIGGAVYPIVIEQVHAMPRQGVSSMFNFGRHTGAVEGWAVNYGGPVHWASPARWKKHFALSSDKRASLDRARLEFGDNELWRVLANDGIAEAALIALWWLNQSANSKG